MRLGSDRLASGRRLLIAALLGAALLATPVVVDSSDSAAPEPLAAQGAAGRFGDRVRADAERQHATLVDEDTRLLRLARGVRPGSGPYMQAFEEVDTLVLTARGLAYDLADLQRSGAVETLPTGDLLLTRSIFVAPGARLAIDAPGRTLRLRSQRSGFVSLVAWKGDLVLRGTEGNRLRVSSWDPHHKRPDTDVVDGRAYIREVSGEMQVAFVNASHLGFWAGRTSGVAWTGSARTEATGSIIGSSFRANHYGAFASRGEGLSIADAAFTANAVDGLALHRRTVGTTIRASTASGNLRHGFSADQGSESVAFTGVSAAHNAAYGIYFDGAPLSGGQSAGGASLRTYGEISIVGGLLRDNGSAGLGVREGHGIDVTGTRVTDNRDGIVLADTGSPASIENVMITGRHRLGISVTGGSAAVRDNQVIGGETGIRIRDAAVSVTGNDVAQLTGHGISVIGAATGSTVVGNAIAGRGPSGLDTFRLHRDRSVEFSRNDLESWTRDRDDWEYWSTFIPNHPMLLLWVILIGLPLACAVRGRERSVPIGTMPYRDHVRHDRPPPVLVGSEPFPAGRTT
jgi:hypothetical protein